MSVEYRVTVVEGLQGRRMIVEHPDGGEVRCSWDVLQALKDAYLGPEVCAVEVFPPADEVVDEVNRRHFYEVDTRRVPSLYRRDNPAFNGS